MKTDALVKIVGILLSLIMGIVVFMGTPTMWPSVPIVLALLILIFAVWEKLTMNKPIDILYRSIILVFIVSSFGCKIYQKWGQDVPFLSPGTIMRFGMLILLVIGGYLIFLMGHLGDQFKRKRGNIEKESMVLIEKTWAEQWESFRRLIFKTPPSPKADDAELDGIFFDLGEVVRENRD